jgi:hypothetical protein
MEDVSTVATQKEKVSLELAFRILYAFVEDLQAVIYGGNYTGTDGSTFERITVFSRWQ